MGFTVNYASTYHLNFGRFFLSSGHFLVCNLYLALGNQARKFVHSSIYRISAMQSCTIRLSSETYLPRKILLSCSFDCICLSLPESFHIDLNLRYAYGHGQLEDILLSDGLWDVYYFILNLCCSSPYR